MSIGYACLTIGVQNTNLSRCSLKNAEEDHIRSIIVSNLSALETIIDYNSSNKIMLFRISSDIIPFGSHEINQVPWWEDYREKLLELGQKIKEAEMRVSMHPGQYTVLNSPEPKIVKNAIRDLEYHNRFLDALGMNHKSKIILHIGGVYGNKKSAMKCFCNHFLQLPNPVKNRLVIENDDKNYTIEEVLEISKQLNIPVVFDNLHHRINPPQTKLTDAEWMICCGRTWKEQDGIQKIHYSQQKEGKIQGSHSDTIVLSQFLNYYVEFPNKNLDIMLEVKDKNLSAIKCIKTVIDNATSKELEEEWARYKYFVLSKSARLYQEIRELLKDKTAHTADEFYEKIERALLLEEDTGAQVNAAQHVWSYIRGDCSAPEKNRFDKLMNEYQLGEKSILPVKNHLFRCATKRNQNYLVNSLYFFL